MTSTDTTEYSRVGMSYTAHRRTDDGKALCSKRYVLDNQRFTRATVEESPYLACCIRCENKAAQTRPVVTTKNDTNSTTLSARDVIKIVHTMSDAMRAMVIAAILENGVRVVPSDAPDRTVCALITRSIVKSNLSNGPRYPLTTRGLAVRAWLTGDDQAINEMQQVGQAAPTCAHCDATPLHGLRTCDRHTAARHRPDKVKPNALREAVGVAINAMGAKAGLRPLSWTHQSMNEPTVLTGHASSGDYHASEIPELVTTWAAFLGLLESETYVVAGTMQYRGTVDGFKVNVWGVTDRQAFDSANKNGSN